MQEKLTRRQWLLSEPPKLVAQSASHGPQVSVPLSESFWHGLCRLLPSIAALQGLLQLQIVDHEEALDAGECMLPGIDWQRHQGLLPGVAWPHHFKLAR